MSKTIAQQHYEADCTVRPCYHDGTPRKAWEQLRTLEQSTWEKGNFRIYLSHTAGFKQQVAEVTSIDAARAFLAGWGEIICFELDEDNLGSADCALLRASGMLEIYSIEPA